MNYELRNPQATDLVPVAKIIKAIGLKNITDCFNSKEIDELKRKVAESEVEPTDEDSAKAGILVMTNIGELVLEKLEVVEHDVHKFMANLSGLEVDVVRTMDIVEFIEMFMAIIRNPKFADFIKVVLKSFKSE